MNFPTDPTLFDKILMTILVICGAFVGWQFLRWSADKLIGPYKPPPLPKVEIKIPIKNAVKVSNIRMTVEDADGNIWHCKGQTNFVIPEKPANIFDTRLDDGTFLHEYDDDGNYIG